MASVLNTYQTSNSLDNKLNRAVAKVNGPLLMGSGNRGRRTRTGEQAAPAAATVTIPLADASEASFTDKWANCDQNTLNGSIALLAVILLLIVLRGMKKI